MTEETLKMPRKNKLSNKSRARLRQSIKVIVVLCAVVGISASIILYRQHQKDQKLINASVTDSTSAQTLVQKVSRLMLLPKDEQPTIATVSDTTKLPKQPFFKHAQNGDKVLVYSKSKTAVLYDPDQNLILAVSPLDTESSKP